ncbi:MAG: hypothetical protein ACK5RL_07050 [Acidimicrobiales bacterium]
MIAAEPLSAASSGLLSGPLVTAAVVVVVQWLAAAAAGWAVLGLAGDGTRRRMGPAGPAVGLAALVAVGTLGASLASMRIVTPVVLVAVAAGVVARVVRRGAPTWSEVTAVVAPLVLPALGLVVLGLPLTATGAGTVMVTANNDAMFYVSAAEWAVDHRLTDPPEMGPTPTTSEDAPADASALFLAVNNLRIGDVVLAAAPGALGAGPLRHVWMPQMMGWLLIVPASLAGALAWLGGERRVQAATVAVGSVVLTTSTVLAHQVWNQNSASVLGIVLAPMAIAGVWAWMDGTDDRGPAPLAALLLVGLLGSYLEFTPILGLAFLIVALARRPGRIPATVGRGVQLAALTVVIGPVAVLRTVRSLLFLSGVTSDGFSTQYRYEPVPVLVARYLGSAWPFETVARGWVTLGLSVVVLGGFLAVVVAHRSRFLWLGLAVGGAALAWYVTAVVGNDYSHQRTLEILQPLLLLAAVLGWMVVADRFDERTEAAPGRPRSAATVAVTLAWTGVTLAAVTTTIRAIPPDDVLELRAVNASYDALDGWAARYGGAGGADLTVVTSGYEATIWAADALRDHPDVDYPLTYLGYLWEDSFTDDRVDRYVLVDRDTIVTDPDAVPIEANDRFRLYDTEATGPLVLVSPRRFAFTPTEHVGTDRWAWLLREGELAVVRTTGAPRRVDLRVSAPEWMAPLDLRVDVEGARPETVVLETTPTDLVVDLDDDPVTLIDLDPGGWGRAAPDGSDDRPLAVRVEAAP